MESKILNDFCFHKPKTLDEALVLIDKYQENGLLMEGGSEVIPNMKSLVVTPDHIISLKHIPEFFYLRYTPGEGLHIGKLSVDTGELSVEGRVFELSYEDERPVSGFWSRLFG